MPKTSQTEIQQEISELYELIDSTTDPETIRQTGKKIVDLESKLQKLKSKRK